MFQWQTIEECCALTLGVIQQPQDWEAWQKAARTQAAQFSEARFTQTLYEMIGK
jgi:hypothetical protein